MKSFSQENKLIQLMLNKEIYLDDGWAGESITLIKGNNNYFLLKKKFGSGLPIIYEVKYEIEYKADDEIETGKIIEISKKHPKLNDKYNIKLNKDNKIIIFFNQKQLQMRDY